MSDGVPINLCEADKKDFGEKNVKKKLEEMTARVSTDMCEECRKICQKNVNKYATANVRKTNKNKNMNDLEWAIQDENIFGGT